MFDSSKEDGFGESLLSSLLYAYGTDEVTKSPEDEQNMASMIIAILESDNFDFNIQDINLDTAINIAAEKPKMNWIVKALASNPNVDINVVNDFNRALLVMQLPSITLRQLRFSVRDLTLSFVTRTRHSQRRRISILRNILQNLWQLKPLPRFLKKL